MGFDVFAINEEQENNYFRNNCWWWRPMWKICWVIGAINEHQHEEGSWNNGYEFDEEDALKIHTTIEKIKDEPKLLEVIELVNAESEHHKSDLKNLLEFSEFCRTSEGFRIH